MKNFLLLCCSVILLFSTTCFAAKPIILLEINGAIGPATQDYIQNGFAKAIQKKAQFIILRIDTPGGLDTSMRGINQAILTSSIPIVSYVAPGGARAASAGTFILYASHVAAMAPGTNLGAASPVSIGEMPSPQDEKAQKSQKNQDTMQKKAMNDAVAYIRSLAELRHRNVAWAESAVRESTSLSAEAALKLNVIDLVAKDIPDLLLKLEGRTIDIQNAAHRLQTKNAVVETIQPNWRYEFLSIITNPTIAYILLLIGIYGLFFEFANPGFILPGLAGLIAILLALYAFQLLPVNYVGLALLLVGITCIIAEVFISSFGIVGIGGVIAFIAGSIMLFDTALPAYSLPWTIILVMSATTLAFFFMVVTLAYGSLRRPIVSGREALIGQIGEVLEYHVDYVLIRIHGEIWSAQTTDSLKVGQKVRVKKISNLILTVEPISTMEKK